MGKNIVREFGSEFDMASNVQFLLEEETDFFSGALLFRSGRDVLRQIARQQPFGRVLLPVLCCQAMVDPFIQNGYQVAFYSLDGDLEVDANALEGLLDQPAILLNLNYFGKNLIADETICLLRELHPNCFFVLDSTQKLLVDSREKDLYDAVVVSVRKWFALPDGGILWQKKGVLETPGPAPEFAALRRRAMEEKSGYLRNGDPVQKASFRSLLNQAIELIDTDVSLAGMTVESATLLRHMDCESVLRKRAKNCVLLAEELCRCPAVTFLPERPREGGLYFPILVENRENVQRLLAAQGVYCPVIWPAPKEQRADYPNVRRIENTMLALPCDQRYGADDMKEIAKMVAAVTERSVL